MFDTLRTDRAEVEAIVRRAGTSFHRGMRILPQDRRAAMYAIYAFCRIVDDIADDPGPLPEKHQALNAWRDKITALYQNTATDPLTRELRAAIHRHALREGDFRAIIDGMQMDADTIIVAPTLAELSLYCDRVAAAVGRLSVRAFGDPSAQADEVAQALGHALQFTNILRDLHEDAQRARLYLPKEWLAQHNIPEAPTQALTHPNLPALCTQMATAAKAHFAQAHAAMRLCNQTAMRPARIMAASYQAILDALITRGWTNLAQPPRVSRWRKLRVLLAGVR